MLVMMKCVAEAIMAKGVKGLAEMVPGGPYLFDVANEALKRMRDHKRTADLRAEVLQAAQATGDDVKKLAEQVAREVAGAAPPEDRLALEMYLTQIPGAVRQSLKRADDPSGRSVPPDFGLNDPADLLKRLPGHAAKFRPGDPLPGKPGWQLVELLGTGGFGEVWLARNPALSALKGAVKFGLDPQARDRLLRHEGSLVNRVMEEGKHPNVVQLLDAHLEGDAPWLMYEYVPGGDLTGLIFAWQNLPPDERVKRATAALQTLAAAVGHFHRLAPPLVHRDLKPANVLVDAECGMRSAESNTGTDSGTAVGSEIRIPNSALRITDFGIGGAAAAASLAQNVSRRSSTGHLASQWWGSHTPLYASPQQQRGDAPDPRDDVHALGVIGFQMLTGKLDAAPGADYAKTLRRLNVPEPLIELLGDCAAHDIDNRPADAHDLADKLAACGAVPRPVAVPVPPDPSPARGLRRRAWDEDLPEPPPLPDDHEPVLRGKGFTRGLLFLFGLAFLVCLGVPLLLFGLFSASGGSVGPGSRPTPVGEPVPNVEKMLTITGVPGRTADVFFSPDGATLATVSDAGRVVVWNAPAGGFVEATGKFLNWEAETKIRGTGPAFSPDGTRFAVGSPGPGANDRIDVFRAGTSINDARTGLGDTPLKLAFSPDGRWLVAGGESKGKVKAWDVGKPAKPLELVAGTSQVTHTLNNEPCGIVAVAFGHRGQRLMTAGGDHVRLWKTDAWPESLAPEASFGYLSRITAAAVDPDPRCRWVGAGGANGVVRVWDVDQPDKPYEQSRANAAAIKQLAFSTARHVAAVDAAGAACVWEARAPSAKADVTSHGKGVRVNAAAFNPEGSLLATAADDKMVRFWDPFTGRPHAATAAHAAEVTAVAYSPDGNRLAAADASGTVIVWQVPNPKKKLGD